LAESAIFRAIDQILWTDWDPIGLNDLQICRNEYRSYVPSIFDLKVAGADCETIAIRLLEISSQDMGIDLMMEFCREVAEKIIRAY